MEVKALVVRGDPALESVVRDWLRCEHNVAVEVVPHDAGDVASALARFRPDLMVADEVALSFVSEILRTYPETSVLTLSGHFPGVVLYEARPRHKAARRAIRRLRERRWAVPRNRLTSFAA
jgi:chemotaxis response regulator CheB